MTERRRCAPIRLDEGYAQREVQISIGRYGPDIRLVALRRDERPQRAEHCREATRAWAARRRATQSATRCCRAAAADLRLPESVRHVCCIFKDVRTARKRVATPVYDRRDGLVVPRLERERHGGRRTDNVLQALGQHSLVGWPRRSSMRLKRAEVRRGGQRRRRRQVARDERERELVLISLGRDGHCSWPCAEMYARSAPSTAARDPSLESTPASKTSPRDASLCSSSASARPQTCASQNALATCAAFSKTSVSPANALQHR
mmetsp:Transcript_22696/g.77754  ORF Transcript_22696/g.77754 Transcript_22696/m.77754 type:complete len:262 (-) Transcript_22696:176-961(-)